MVAALLAEDSEGRQLLDLRVERTRIEANDTRVRRTLLQLRRLRDDAVTMTGPSSVVRTPSSTPSSRFTIAHSK
jgi:hypothetical protein